MYPRSEILFPRRCIKGLRSRADHPWPELIDSVLRRQEDSLEVLSFILMMIELCGCLACDMGSYKASLGCDICSQRAVQSVKGSGKALLQRYVCAQARMKEYLETGQLRPSEDSIAEVSIA